MRSAALSLLLLVAVGCGGPRSAVADKPTPSVAADPATAAAFLALVRAGKADDAWTSTSAEFKSFMGKEDFRAFVRRHPAFKADATPGELTVLSDKGYPAAECVFRTAGGKPQTIRVQLGSDGGTWKVDRVRVE